ncbi:MAG: hypothetical protein GY700_16245, partial [Propionibacteriaceae bacterium]|nr:hypothetical protein [Propionibacteriaceae bacterium]
MGTDIGYDWFTHNESIPVMESYTLLRDGAYWFRYTRIEDMAVSRGDLLEIGSATLDEMTKDRNGSVVGDLPGGVACAAITDAYYGFVQVAGIGFTGIVPSVSTTTAVSLDLTTDGSVGAGEGLMAHATTDGGADTMAAGSEHLYVGYALTDDDSITL